MAAVRFIPVQSHCLVRNNIDDNPLVCGRHSVLSNPSIKIRLTSLKLKLLVLVFGFERLSELYFSLENERLCSTFK